MKTRLLLISFSFIYFLGYGADPCDDDTIICKADVDVALGPLCDVEVTFDMILYEYCPDYSYKVQLFEAPAPPFDSDLPNPIDGSYIGSSIVALVTDVGSNNACTANVHLKDLTPPFIDFVGAPLDLSCQDDLSEVISIGVVDNCGIANYKISDIRHECVPCEYDKVFITYELTDEYGNITEVTIPIDLNVSATAPNLHRAVFTVELEYMNAIDETDTTVYTTDSKQFSFDLQNGIEVGGTLTEDIIWTANSRIIVTAPLMVPSGVRLTIEEGVEVRFEKDTFGSCGFLEKNLLKSR